jgi:hypothetical protein
MEGDRHLRPDPDGRIGGSPASLATVLIKVQMKYASSSAGQHLLQLLVNLLARQFGVVREILLELDECDLHEDVILYPRIATGTLLAGLMALGEAVGGKLTTTRVADGTISTVVVFVGDNLDPTSLALPAIAVTGHGWRAKASTRGSLREIAPTSTNPLGPYLAACIAAGFVLKSAYGKQTPVEVDLDLWAHAGEEGPDLAGINLPTAYVLGLGAVGAAFAVTLAAARGLSGRLIGVDPQEMSETDCNRLLSGTTSNVGELKIDLFAKLFHGQIEAYTFKGRWPQDYLGDPTRSVPRDTRREEEALRFEWVIACVDRDRDRVGIANALPHYVFGGSTLGMAAQTAYYSVEGACECLGCNHRTPVQLGVEKQADELRALSREARQSWYEEHGASAREQASIEEYLSDPRCAGPGEADLARLGVQGRVDWAVGFVSAAAGLILAARFIRAVVMGVEAEIANGSELRYLFWSEELLFSHAHRLAGCPVCDTLEPEWLSLWASGRREDTNSANSLT